MVLEETPERPLDSKEIKPVSPKGNQPQIFIGSILILKLKLQYFGHLIQRVDLLEKSLMLEKTGQEEKGAAEDEMVSWNH